MNQPMDDKYKNIQVGFDNTTGPVWIAPQPQNTISPHQADNDLYYWQIDQLQKAVQQHTATSTIPNYACANLVAQLLKQIDPQDDGEYKLLLPDSEHTITVAPTINLINAELSQHESCVRVEALSLGLEFVNGDGIWRSKSILTIKVRLVSLMDLGDEK